MLSRFWYGLLVLAAAAPAAAVPVHLDLQRAGAPAGAEPLGATVRIEPLGAGRKEPATELRVAVPGRQRLDLGAGAWRVQGEAPGFWSGEQAVTLVDGREAQIEVRFLPTGALRGRLELPRGQKSPDALEVRFEPAPPVPASRAAQGTGGAAKGALSCPVRGDVWECAVPAGLSDLRLRAAALVPLYRWGVGVEAGRTLDLGVLAFRPGASVSGRVITEQGLPADAAQIALAPEVLGTVGEEGVETRLAATRQEARTNDRGFFQLEGVAPGTYTITASSSGMAPARVSSLVVREGLEAQLVEPLVLAPPVTLQVEISPPLDPYGQPWTVQLSRESHAGGTFGPAGKGQAGRDGRWSQPGLAPGKYRIKVAGDLESQWAYEEVEVRRTDSPVQIEIPVVEIRGRLTLGDAPLAATLWFGGRSGGRRVRFDADEDGELAGFLPEEGTWRVQLVNESEGLRLALKDVEVRVPRGKRAAEVEIRVPDTTLEGEVVDESGRGVPGALISLTGQLRSSDIAAGAEGRFRVRGLMPDSVFVEAEEGGRSAGPVEALLTEGRKSPWLRLVLRKEMTVQGRVVSQAGPVAGAEVMAWPTVELVGAASADQSVTGPDGSFRLRFPAQTRALTVFVSAPGHAFHMSRVALTAGRPLELPIETLGGTLVLELPRGDTDAPAPAPLLVHGGTFTPLRILARWASLQRAEQTDPGKLVLPNLESGEYSLCLNAADELRQGREPAGRCARGVLLPNAELRLSPPPPGAGE